MTRLRTAGRAVPLTAGEPAGLSVLVEAIPRIGINSSVIEPPIPCRRDFSCLICTALKCDSSSFHLISSRPILERVDDTLDIDLTCNVISMHHE